ncbi:MAG: hypothetical protein KA764_17860 [Anaerolineales bacterium]|nr:hypothetical protein [Anaerolineales bacterium]
MLRRAFPWIFVLAAAGLLAGCQANPATTLPPTAAPAGPSETVPPPTPTAVIPASATPVPATATPAATATETVTPTPAAPPTPDPNLGVGATLYEDKFDGTRWGWTFQDEVVNFSLGAGQLNAVMARSDSFWRITSGPDFIRAGDEQVRVTVRTNLCYDQDEYGLLFRNTSTPDFKFNGYLFKVNCGGQARVELLRDSAPSILLDWTPVPGIVAGAPAENTLTVWAAKAQMHFYINDRYVGTVTDQAFADGDMGLYLRDRTNGGVSVSFADLTIKAVTAP